jgi:hypothetical protein
MSELPELPKASEGDVNVDPRSALRWKIEMLNPRQRHMMRACPA